MAHLVEVFAQVKRVLHPTGTCWIVIGDSYWSATATATATQGRNESKSPATSLLKNDGRRLSGVGARHYEQQQRGLTYQRRAVGLKPKDLIGIPWMLAFALRDDGWYLRQEVMWHKLSAMPESVGDRCTRSHETIFMLSKRPRYFYDAMAIAERAAEPRAYPTSTGEERKADGAALRRGDPGQSGDVTHLAGVGGNGTTRNARSVWTINPQPFSARAYGVRDIDHYAVFPEDLAQRCILAGTSEAGCCPACGAPYRRVVERERFDRSTDRLYGGTLRHNPSGKVPGSNTRGCPAPLPVTTGWEAGCSCGAGPPIPCTVADIFCGSGTTLLVAKKLGRSAIGIDLSAEYCRLAEKRCASTPSTLFSAAVLADDGMIDAAR